MPSRNQIVAAAAVAGAGYFALSRLTRRAPVDLHGKTVLITGGSRGLGLQLAREFGSQGAAVAICARDAAELDAARQDLTARGIRTHTVVCDVTQQEQVRLMVGEVEAQLGPLDFLVNNAGLIQVGPFSEMTVADFERTMNVIFWGTLYTTFAVLPGMRRRRAGHIVNITSIGGKVSVPHLLPYSCAKFAAVAFSEGLRTELAPERIRVTTIVPGLMRTGSHLQAEFKGQHAQEYAWFAAGAASSLVSIDAQRAARSIVRAAVRGDREKILSAPAGVLARLHPLFPEFSTALLSLVNRLLPAAPENPSGLKTGAEVHINSRLWDLFTQPGQAAAQSLNQLAQRY